VTRHAGWRGQRPVVTPDAGVTTVELAVTLVVGLIVLAMSVPATAYSIDTSRARNAALFLASHFRAAQQHARDASRQVAIVFDQIGTRWTFRTCEDGNGNGVRRTDLAAGRDVVKNRENTGQCVGHVSCP